MARPMHALPSKPPRERPPDEARSVVSLAAPKHRRPSWTIAGVVLVGLAMALGAWVFATSSQQISIVVAARSLEPGDVIAGTDLRVVQMGRAGGLRAIRPSQQSLIVGKAARGPIPEGTVLNTGLFVGRDRVIPAGQVVVGARGTTNNQYGTPIVTSLAGIDCNEDARTQLTTLHTAGHDVAKYGTKPEGSHQ